MNDWLTVITASTLMFILGMFSAPPTQYLVEFNHPTKSTSYQTSNQEHCANIQLGVNGDYYNVCYNIKEKQ